MDENEPTYSLTRCFDPVPPASRLHTKVALLCQVHSDRPSGPKPATTPAHACQLWTKQGYIGSIGSITYLRSTLWIREHGRGPSLDCHQISHAKECYLNTNTANIRRRAVSSFCHCVERTEGGLFSDSIQRDDQKKCRTFIRRRVPDFCHIDAESWQSFSIKSQNVGFLDWLQ